MATRHCLMMLWIAVSCAISPRVWAQPHEVHPPVTAERDGAAEWNGAVGTLTINALHAQRGVLRGLPPGESPMNVVQFSSCVMQISCDVDAQGREGIATAVAVLNSTVFQDSVVEKVLHIPSENRRRVVLISSSPTDESRVQVEVALLKADVALPAKAAENLLLSVRDRLQAALQQSADVQRQIGDQRSTTVEKEIAAAKEHLAEIRTRVREYRTATVNAMIEPGGDVSDMIMNLRNQKRSLEPELRSQRSQLRQILGTPPRAELAEEAASLRENIAAQEERLKEINDQLTKLQDPNLVKIAEQIPVLVEEEQQVQGEIAQMSSNRMQRLVQVQGPTKYIVTILGGSAEK